MPDVHALRGHRSNNITDLVQVIYISQPFGYDEPTLAGILLDARRYNLRDGITGALVCRHDAYLQLLEGPEPMVQAAYERISRDDRHCDVRQLVCAPIAKRSFGDWAMLHDPANSWLWSEEEIEQGALERATAVEIQDVFVQLAERV